MPEVCRGMCTLQSSVGDSDAARLEATAAEGLA